MTAAQKAPYEKRAADAKQAFEKALEEFKAQGGVAGSRRKEKADAKSDLLDKRAKKRARLERDADKPKRPQTAYWLWLGENRAALIKEAGTGAAPAVAKLGGEKWKKLDAKLKAMKSKSSDQRAGAFPKPVEVLKCTPDVRPEGVVSSAICAEVESGLREGRLRVQAATLERAAARAFHWGNARVRGQFCANTKGVIMRCSRL